MLYQFQETIEQLFAGFVDNVVINACGETNSCFTPFLFECTRTHHCGFVHTRALSRTHARTLVLFLYFHWRRVSQKSTFNGKTLVFLTTRLHRRTRDRTSERTLTGNVRIGNIYSVTDPPWIFLSSERRRVQVSNVLPPPPLRPFLYFNVEIRHLRYCERRREKCRPVPSRCRIVSEAASQSSQM